MEQSDYILREIQKIGEMLSKIRKKIAGAEVTNSQPFDFQLEEVKNILLDTIGLNLDEFLLLSEKETKDYIAGNNGLNNNNTELLGDFCKTMGEKTVDIKSQLYLKKALELFELCNFQDRTYSIDREYKISSLKSILNN